MVLKEEVEDLVTNYCQNDFVMLINITIELIKLQATTMNKEYQNENSLDDLLNGTVKPDILR